MSDFRDCADKLKAMIDIEDTFRGYGSTLLTKIDTAIAELANPIKTNSEYAGLLDESRSSYVNFISGLGFCNYATESLFADVVNPSPGDTPERGLQEYMASKQLTGTTWVFTNGNVNVTCSTTDGAATTEVQAGDYIFLEADGVASRALVASVTNDDTIVLNAGYGGAGGSGSGIIEQTFESRVCTKSYTYGSTMGDKAKIFWHKVDEFGYDIETPLRTNTFKLRCTQAAEYSGFLELVCMVSGRPTFPEGEQFDILDSTGCRIGEQLQNLEIPNSFSTSGILPVSAATMDSGTSTASDLANVGWYSSDWSNADIETTVFFHRDEGSKDPTNWSGVGRSLELESTGAHTQTILLDKEDFNYRVPYLTIMIYKVDDHDTDGTLGFDLGTVSTTTTGSATLTGNISVTNGNTTVTGTGTKFIEEVSVGDKIRLSAHAGNVATEVASVDSDTQLTLVAGGYLGATGGPAAGTCHHTGWHMLSYIAYPSAFMPAGDLELDVYRTGPTTGSMNVYSIQIFPLTLFKSLGAYLFVYAGQTDIAQDDEIQLDITVSPDSKIQRWMVENTFESYPHNTNPSVTDP